MTGPKTRISAYGLFGIGNLGNEGSLLALRRYLQAEHPQIRLTCISGNPAVVNKEHGLVGVPLMTYPGSDGESLSLLRKVAGRLMDIPRTFRLAGQADLVVVPGMGVFEETLGVRPWTFPYWLFLMGLAARLRGTGVAYLSVGVERPANAVTRWLFRWTLRLASYRSYRDELSRVAAQSMGIRTTTGEVYPDLAFALPAPAGGRVRPGHVALGVMRYYGFADDPVRGAATREAYVAGMSEFVARLVESGHSVSLLVGDRVDREVALELEQRINQSRPHLPPGAVSVSAAANLADLMVEMSTAEAVIASRFHNVVCALRLAKPTVSIAYAAKNTALMTEFGLGDYCQSLDSLDFELLFTQLEDILRTHPDREAAMQATLRRYVAELDLQYDVLSRRFVTSPTAQAVTT